MTTVYSLDDPITPPPSKPYSFHTSQLIQSLVPLHTLTILAKEPEELCRKIRVIHEESEKNMLKIKEPNQKWMTVGTAKRKGDTIKQQTKMC